MTQLTGFQLVVFNGCISYSNQADNKVNNNNNNNKSGTGNAGFIERQFNQETPRIINHPKKPLLLLLLLLLLLVKVKAGKSNDFSS